VKQTVIVRVEGPVKQKLRVQAALAGCRSLNQYLERVLIETARLKKKAKQEAA
jgi:predicted HicB family RNase H-like nuclease